MIRRLAVTTLWLLGCTAVGLALYWVLLNTPDSNVLMLAGSALLVVALLAVGGVAASGAVVLTRGGGSRRRLGRQMAAGIPLFVLALVPVVLVAWMALRADRWLVSTSGEISAWFIARLGWSDVSWLITGARFLLAWLRWVVGPWLGLTLLAASLDPGRRGRVPSAWMTSATRWRSLALATLWFVALVALPWRFAYWRPPAPAVWLEPFLAGARLATIALVMTIGVALMVRAAVSGGVEGGPTDEPEGGPGRPRRDGPMGGFPDAPTDPRLRTPSGGSESPHLHEALESVEAGPSDPPYRTP